MTFGGTVDGAHNLTATAGSYSFGGALGGTVPLGAVSLTTSGALALPSITAASVFAQTGSGDDLTIPLGKIINASGSGTAIDLASGGNFINNEGANALNASNGRWLIYSANPANDTIGSLASGFRRFSCSYGGSCPALGSGNGLLYSMTPTLTATLVGGLTLTYGDAAPSLAGYAYSLTGYLGSDASSDSVTGTLTGSTNYAQGSNIGTYYIDYASGALASALGYSVATYANDASAITVGKAHLTVTADGGKTAVYGASSLPSLTDTITGYVDGQTYATSGVTGAATLNTNATAYNGTAHSGSNVGSYDIDVAAGSLTAGNYDFTYVDATNGLTVTPATLTVTPASPTRLYGQTVAYGQTIGGYVNGDTASIVTGSASPIDPTNTMTSVGTYTLAGSTGTLGTTSNDYVFMATNGTLTINPAHLALTANNQTIAYGASDPVLTYSYTGLVNGQTSANFTGFLTRSPGSASGDYSILQNTLAATGNYTIFAYAPGILTIGQMQAAPIPQVINPTSAVSAPVAIPPVPTVTILPDTVARVSQSAILNVGASNTNPFAIAASNTAQAVPDANTDTPAQTSNGTNQTTQSSQPKTDTALTAKSAAEPIATNIAFLKIDPKLAQTINSQP